MNAKVCQAPPFLRAARCGLTTNLCCGDTPIILPEWLTVATPICRLSSEVLTIGRLMQKGVLLMWILMTQDAGISFYQMNVYFYSCYFRAGSRSCKAYAIGALYLTVCFSFSAYHANLASSPADAGMKYTRKKTSTTCQGAIDLYGCTGPGCLVQLRVLFDSSSDDVVVSYNGKQHKHWQKPHSGWGLPDKTKKV